MKYQSTLYVVSTKNTPIEILPDLGQARQFANTAALNDPGRDYQVYEWQNGEDWRDRPTKYAYRGFYAETREEAIERENAEISYSTEWKAVHDREWGRMDSERGHANMQTAHNQLLNWK